MGSTGTLDVDGLTVQLVPTGGTPTTNLVVNGDFELGDPSPAYWWTSKDVRRVFPGNQGSAVLELTPRGATAMVGVALPVDRFPELELSISAWHSGLRGADGAMAAVYFVDRFGRSLPRPDRAWASPS